MYKIQNIIILAAGRGSRMEELTNELPKPLLLIKDNISIIEKLILQVKKITNNIHIVIGYKNEKFDQIKNKYKEINFYTNNNWETQNNISSINCVIDHLENSLIINGDTLILDENVLSNNYDSTCMYAEQNENINEWLIKLDENNNISEFETNPTNKKGFYQREITFIDENMSEKIKKEINSFDKNLHYEFLVLYCSKKYNLPLKIFEIEKNKVFDLDSKVEYLNYPKNN